MTDQVIACPKCKQEFTLTDALAKPIIQATTQRLQAEHHAREAALAEQAEELRQQREALAKSQTEVDEQVDKKVAAKRQEILDEAKRSAKLAFESDIQQNVNKVADLEGVVASLNAKLGTAQAAEAEYLKKARALDDAKREIALDVQKQVAASLDVVKLEARQQAEGALNLTIAEREEKIASMQRTIAELKQKAEQGSQQLQGEVQELALEDALRAAFPLDVIEPVPKGTHGGDILHRVVGPSGQVCGTILWECKRTKNWSAGWLASLRDDQRLATATVAVIASQALPKGLSTFGLVEEVWVTRPEHSVPLATALRIGLVDTSAARIAAEGQQTKTQLMYQYLCGPQFRQRVEAIVEKFKDMREDLDAERKLMQKSWAKRERQIQVVVDSTFGMYGDLKGIAGKTLPELEVLDVKLLGEGADANF